MESEKREMGGDVACVDVAPVPEGRQRCRYLAVGMFDGTVRVLSLDPDSTLKVLATQVSGLLFDNNLSFFKVHICFILIELVSVNNRALGLACCAPLVPSACCPGYSPAVRGPREGPGPYLALILATILCFCNTRVPAVPPSHAGGGRHPRERAAAGLALNWQGGHGRGRRRRRTLPAGDAAGGSMNGRAQHTPSSVLAGSLQMLAAAWQELKHPGARSLPSPRSVW